MQVERDGLHVMEHPFTDKLAVLKRRQCSIVSKVILAPVIRTTHPP